MLLHFSKGTCGEAFAVDRTNLQSFRSLLDGTEGPQTETLVEMMRAKRLRVYNN